VFEVEDLTPRVASQVFTDLETLLSGTHADELRELLVARGVIVMRGIAFDLDQQRAFTETLGNVRPGIEYETGPRGLLKVRELLGARWWHSDVLYDVVPPFASVLTPYVIAPEGGQTEFANTYAAYEDLPADEQEYLSTLEVVCSMKVAQDKFNPDASIEELEGWARYRQVNPLVWRHGSGHRSLVLGASVSHVLGLQPYDSFELLDRLVEHATQPQFVYRHEWEEGDVVIWDNTGTMHRVLPYDLACGRELHRFTIEGVESLASEPATAELSPAM